MNSNTPLETQPRVTDAHYSAENPNRIPVEVVILFEEEKEEYRDRSEPVLTYFFGTLPRQGDTLQWDVGQSGEAPTTAEDVRNGRVSYLMVVEEVHWNAGRTQRGSIDDSEKVVCGPTVYLRPKDLTSFQEQYPDLL